MISVPFCQVDAFTDRPFAGNPAAVCLLPDAGEAEVRRFDDQWMQNVAAEMNLSETAFVRRRPDGERFDLRWFTPTTEVDLCGHATLASAHVVWESGALAEDQAARFHTRSGWLTCTKCGDLIGMDFPATPAEEMPPAEHPDALLQMLGVEARFVGRHAYFLLLDVGSDREVRELDPDFARWLSVDTRSAIVTAPSDDPQFDFVSRFFAPAIGINEDPVTGAAHCCLGPYWADRLGKATLAGFQASARGGVVHVAVRGDRVTLGGNAVTVMRGELTA